MGSIPIPLAEDSSVAEQQLKSAGSNPVTNNDRVTQWVECWTENPDEEKVVCFYKNELKKNGIKLFF